ncbi:hypothetical protein [Thermocatellispora tengchongensis]|uniref:hypothetical protein n=1 Tax=Thermocatellispora tengchongensis TaxID=1073253 RepID=UPI003642AA72
MVGLALEVDRLAAAAQRGAFSTTVTAQPRRASQWARAGPAMLAPEMRTVMCVKPVSFMSPTFAGGADNPEMIR